MVDSEPQLETVMETADLEHLHTLVAGANFGALSETYIPPQGLL